MLGCEPGVAAITREKGAADVTAWGAHRPDHRPHQDGDDDGSDQYKPGQEEKNGEDQNNRKSWLGLIRTFFLPKNKTSGFHPFLG